MAKASLVNELAKNLVKLKHGFASVYHGTSNIQEIIPVSNSELFAIDPTHLDLLHLFASSNPIYYHSYEDKILDTPCIVYEGDINKYWLNSIQHGSSRAPFSPTWILSAYVCSLLAQTLDYKQLVDIGSGDGRIAYCAKVLGMDSFGIEIDETLIKLQHSISNSTKINYVSNCADAILFDYDSISLTKPAFFIGGLAQMGGTVLAGGILDHIKNYSLQNFGMVFAGTASEKYSIDPLGKYGWGTLIDKYDLQTIDTLILPTAWTFREPDDTYYVFTNYDH